MVCPVMKSLAADEEKHHGAHQIVRHLYALDGAAGDARGEIIAR